ncbi:MAG: tetratricopeptide repeat protein [Methylobacteriaceae bacterium]|nr:tetratricopeptide repeat protein [Methylobacteriaceae bacterium]
MSNSIGINESTELPRGEAALNRFAEDWGQRYDRNPKDKKAAMTYASALRALGQHAQAAAVLQSIAARNPQDREILGAYGKSLADAGRLKEAAAVLANAHTPERPNWSILSAQGSVADQLGEHDEAQNYYKAAIRIRPDEPSVMSNLGLSYALSKRLPLAEETLRDAANNPKADMRVRQNLALVLALEGKFGEAEDWSRRDLAPIDAAANVASIRKMIAQSNTWRDLQKLDRQAQRRDPAKNMTAVAATRPVTQEIPASLANAE